MVKFSAAEGKGKRRRLCASSSSRLFLAEDEGEDHARDADDDYAEEEDAACNGVGGTPKPSSEGGRRSSNDVKEAVTVSIDPDVLDCPICCEIPPPPIFQCENGHIACSSCCAKMKKCHSCSCPIGPSRCLALENVLESIKLSCHYASNGCGEIISYAQRRSHEEVCIYSPCLCPIIECTFAGSLQQLSQHFSSTHGDHATFFLYNQLFEFLLDENEPFHVLVGEDGILFLLLNRSVPVGNAVLMACIGPDSLKGDFSYQLTSRSKESLIQFESSVTSIKQWDGVFPSKDFLVIPQGFCGESRKLSLDVCVRYKVS